MATDWQTIRELMSAAIDFAEAVETAGFSEEDRDPIVQAGGQSVSLYDFMVSAHTVPEALRYDVIRQSMGEACGELVGAADVKPAREQIQAAISWYRNALPHIKSALRAITT